MIMPEKPEIDAWNEARDLLLRLESLTTELEQSLADGPRRSCRPCSGSAAAPRLPRYTEKRLWGPDWTGKRRRLLQSIAQTEIGNSSTAWWRPTSVCAMNWRRGWVRSGRRSPGCGRPEWPIASIRSVADPSKEPLSMPGDRMPQHQIAT